MTEIRPIVEAEGDEFLRVLCGVFELDFERARTVFFREPLFDLRRKWALFQEGEIVSVLTTVPLEFGFGNAIGIAGVATKDERRGSGYAGALLEVVLKESSRSGEKCALLFARDARLYERLGFQLLDEVVKAPLPYESEKGGEVMAFSEVWSIYNRWANESSNRLKRSERRWEYWKWNFRICSAWGDGYLCNEGYLVRECIPGLGRAPVSEASEWQGLRSLGSACGFDLKHAQVDLLLMGRNVPEQPQMFMTDQF